MDAHIAYISLGSNLGDKLENCNRAITELSRIGGTSIAGRSHFYKTEPVDYTDQDWFVNAVVQIKTHLDPLPLLAELKSIQHRAGRTHAPIRFGPRIIDLDIIFYDDAVIQSPDLVVPHPRMHKRAFVLVPICDIDSKIIHPVLKKDVRCLLDALNETAQGIELYQ
jgi:2-amino-4-hydroxy-6-hydroxymethyldihydropteridine diphosphokinase